MFSLFFMPPILQEMIWFEWTQGLSAATRNLRILALPEETYCPLEGRQRPNERWQDTVWRTSWRRGSTSWEMSTPSGDPGDPRGANDGGADHIAVDRRKARPVLGDAVAVGEHGEGKGRRHHRIDKHPRRRPLQNLTRSHTPSRIISQLRAVPCVQG